MILVTGACGFIGSHFVKMLCESTDRVIVVDKLTYAADVDRITDLPVIFYPIDISNHESLEMIFRDHSVTDIINFAAESHVDRSINDFRPFIASNIIGTANLLQLAVKYNISKFLQISTDEVFGCVEEHRYFDEQSKIHPRNPYSASKASAEHFVSAFANTYGLNTLIVNCSNNYGPNQYHEKLIPLTVTKIIQGQQIPVYGDGRQVRDWIYVEDTVRAIMLVFQKGQIGQRYCVGGHDVIANIDLVEMLLDKLDAPRTLINYVADRPGHDRRYATDWKKIRTDLGWEPLVDLSDGLDKTINWVINENRI